MLVKIKRIPPPPRFALPINDLSPFARLTVCIKASCLQLVSVTPRSILYPILAVAFHFTADSGTLLSLYPTQLVVTLPPSVPAHSFAP